MNKKHSPILNLQTKIILSGKLPENSTYINTAFDFLVNYLLEKIKYVVIESSYFCIIKKNANKLVLFFFVKDKKLKKLAVALKLYTYCFKFKFEYFLLVLFAFKDPSTL